MKTLLQINTVVNLGSTGRITEEIGQVAIANGWRSYIAFGRNERTSLSNKIRIGNDWDVLSHGVQTRLFDNHALCNSSRKATKKLIVQLEHIKPDIVLLHNLHGYYINIEVLFGYLSKEKIPVVWTFHDCWPITGHCTYFDFIGCEKWKTECYACPQKTSYPASYLIDRSTKNFNQKKRLFTSLTHLTLIPVSRWLGSILEQSFLKEYPIEVIHNGIDLEVFKPQKDQAIIEKYKLSNKYVLLGVANRWSSRKGLKDFIELSKMFDSKYQIILVGLTGNQIKQLPPNIIGIERTESVKELAGLYGVSDVFINPTYEDNFPTTNIEALACGTPVITYKTGGSPEAIDNETGIVVEKGDIPTLKLAIERILAKGKGHYITACRKRAESFYNKEDRYSDYISLFDKILRKL